MNCSKHAEESGAGWKRGGRGRSGSPRPRCWSTPSSCRACAARLPPPAAGRRRHAAPGGARLAGRPGGATVGGSRGRPAGPPGAARRLRAALGGGAVGRRAGRHAHLRAHDPPAAPGRGRDGAPDARRARGGKRFGGRGLDGWDPERNRLRDPDGDGVWEIRLRLRRGQEARYQFLVDGERWLDDPQAPLRVEDGFGGTSSVLQI